jgi:hypothetical protein
MRRFFIVGIEGITPEQDKEFIRWAHDENGFGWWHWIPNFWLLVGHRENVGCEEILDYLNSVAHNKNKLVLQVTPTTWAGFGPTGPKKNMFDWIRQNWRPDIET